MKLLGAGSVLDHQSNKTHLSKYQFSSKPLFKEIMAIDYALAAVQMAMENAYFTASDIDLIVSISVSPSHLSDEPNILGPRIGHPVQRELAANNAIVMDVLASDWSFALDVAYGFMCCQGISSALILRAECTRGVVNKSDCLIPCDGAGALLVGASKHSGWCVDYKDLAATKACIVPTENGLALENKGYVTHDYTLGDSDISQIQQMVESLVHSNLDKIKGPKTLLCNGLPHSIDLSRTVKMHNAHILSEDMNFAGAFTLPLTLARWCDNPDFQSTFHCLGFDPYKSRLAWYSLEV